MSWRALLSRCSPSQWRVIPNFIKAACGALVFTEYIGGPRIVSGPSMLPRLDAGPQLVIEDTLSASLYKAKNVQRGDLVTFYAMYDYKKHVCKRVIGLAGDIICVHPERSIRIANAREDGRDKRPRGGGDGREPWEVQHVVVPEGHIWVTGDNMSNSRDSREFGPIPLAMVRGRVIAKIFPQLEWYKTPIFDID